ncbi:MAG TPA: dienelactone hydrolase family protein [Anaeromyxobacteraceae bacterium]|nr:dienelactone hydrolase family protein [Anaeromyxobacteraceae bacterium]
MGKMISFPRTTGKSAQGYLAEAKDPKAPGVVVIQEWWGLQGQIKAVCDRLAAAGFTALAPDLFDGKVVPYHDSPAAEAAMKSLDFKAATSEAVRGAAQFLKKRGGKVAITGFCMGGALTVIAAVHVPEFDAAVCFYGLPPESVAAPKDIRVPFQGHFARQDDWCTPAVVDEFERKLKEAGKKFEIYRYDGHHAFMNSERTAVYSDEAAKLAWDRSLQFLREKLA